MIFDKFLGRIRKKDAGGASTKLTSDDIVSTYSGAGCSVTDEFRYLEEAIWNNVRADLIPMTSDGNNNLTLYDAIAGMDFVSMNYPSYCNFSYIDPGSGATFSPGVDFYPYKNGWIFVKVVLNSETFRIKVLIDGEVFAEYGVSGSSMNERFSFHFPVSSVSSWRIEEDEEGNFDGSYEIYFVPCEDSGAFPSSW